MKTMEVSTGKRGEANIAAVASLMADETRATILLALSDGRSLPAGELGRMARVAPSTASWHLDSLAQTHNPPCGVRFLERPAPQKLSGCRSLSF
jgi:Bacterial regulatory protein, arsR family